MGRCWQPRCHPPLSPASPGLPPEALPTSSLSLSLALPLPGLQTSTPPPPRSGSCLAPAPRRPPRASSPGQAHLAPEPDSGPLGPSLRLWAGVGPRGTDGPSRELCVKTTVFNPRGGEARSASQDIKSANIYPASVHATRSPRVGLGSGLSPRGQHPGPSASAHGSLIVHHV